MNGTPLHWSAWEGKLDTTKALVDAKANLNPVAEYGWTPLHLAAYKGHDGPLKVLLDAGADFNLKDNVRACLSHGRLCRTLSSRRRPHVTCSRAQS